MRVDVRDRTGQVDVRLVQGLVLREGSPVERVLGHPPPATGAAAPQDRGPGSAEPAVVDVPLVRRLHVRIAAHVEADRTRLTAIGQQHPHRPLVRGPQRLQHPVHDNPPLPRHATGPAHRPVHGIQAAVTGRPAYRDPPKPVRRRRPADRGRPGEEADPRTGVPRGREAQEGPAWPWASPRRSASGTRRLACEAWGQEGFVQGALAYSGT